MIFTDAREQPGAYFVRFYTIDPDEEGPDEYEDVELGAALPPNNATTIPENYALGRARALASSRTWTSWEVIRRDGLHYGYPYWEWQDRVVHESCQEIDFKSLSLGTFVEVWQTEMPYDPVYGTRKQPGWVRGVVERRDSKKVIVQIPQGDGTTLTFTYNVKAAKGLLRTL